MKTKISIKKLKALVVRKGTHNNRDLALTFNAMMGQLGYTMSKELFIAVSTLSSTQLESLASEVISTLREIVGDDVRYTPMYPNFPQQVMEADYLELYFNAIVHYWSLGTWKPEYQTLPRQFGIEQNKLEVIGLATQQEFTNVFTQLLSSNDSLSAEDVSFVEWFMDNVDGLAYPKQIPYKETMCVVAGKLLARKKDITNLVTTTTDVLRVVTYLSGGDVSLAEDTKFKSLPRSQRKIFTKILDSVISEEDVARHKGKWLRLFHNLHVGDYSDKVYQIASKLRNNKPLETIGGKVQKAIDNQAFELATLLLVSRPGMFARKLDHLMRLADNTASKKKRFRKSDWIVKKFLTVADQVSTRVLMQLLGHFTNRIAQQLQSSPQGIRVAFPKGNTQKALALREQLAPINIESLGTLLEGIQKVLVTKFKQLPKLGKVWIDPRLADCPLPAQMRSASAGKFTVARGTRIPFSTEDEAKNTLRFFIYWVGMDIDLTASLHNANFELIEQISYTHLRSSTYQACHSGDITRAPTGASEFIDITIDKAVRYGARYVAMNVYVFNGPTFGEHEKCYAGWMLRDKPNSNEIYNPKTVKQKVDLTNGSKACIPVIFDLVEGKAIWTDLTISPNSRWDVGFWRGNNIHNNQASTIEVVEAMTSLNNKPTLQTLFTLHAKARGKLVKNKKDADVIFSLEDAFNINKINSEFLV